MTRPHLTVQGALAVMALAWLVPQALAQAGGEGALGVELNKVEDTKDGCRSIFLFDNGTGHQLSRFRLDLILFDQDGVYSKQLLLDMAPLYVDKKTVASFVLDDTPCEKIGSILVNDVPACEDGAGAAVECVKLLEVNSRSNIPLEK
ncbi:MAG: hypothetical protein ACREH6_01520 [Geminicoccaceae bacterium]